MITTENDMYVLPEKLFWQFHHKNKYSALYFVRNVKYLGKMMRNNRAFYGLVCAHLTAFNL